MSMPTCSHHANRYMRMHTHTHINTHKVRGERDPKEINKKDETACS